MRHIIHKKLGDHDFELTRTHPHIYYDNAPRHLQSDQQSSRICYLSPLFGDRSSALTFDEKEFQRRKSNMTTILVIDDDLDFLEFLDESLKQ